MTLAEIRSRAVAFLGRPCADSEENARVSPTPALDVDVILSHILGKDRTWILFHRDVEIDGKTAVEIESALAERRTGLPVAYITHHKEFFGYDFYVTPDVLIPKPDTECLVERAASFIEKLYCDAKSGAPRVPRVCDMCAGSGCISLSLLRFFLDTMRAGVRPGASVARGIAALPEFTAADISGRALAVAQQNAEQILFSRKFSKNTDAETDMLRRKIRFVRTNLFEQIPDSFDVIVSNPPYIPHDEVRALLKDGRQEPPLALDGDRDESGNYSGGCDGLAVIRRLVPQCLSHLAENGVLIMETGEYNAEQTAVLFVRAGFSDVKIETDLNGMMRNVIGIQKRP